jgi:hypothetical protein
MDNSLRLSGDEWQLWAEKLLLRHYGPGEYQKIPDKHRGDAGLEGFTVSSGHAYQMYGPEEPLSTLERCNKHKTKISTDIRKFIKNESLLCSVFGSIKISRWILFVPVYDSKETLEHANKKAQEVIKAGLSYVNADFKILIQDEETFSKERDELLNLRTNSISIDGGKINECDINEWVDKNTGLADIVEEKLTRHPGISSRDQRRKIRTAVIRAYLMGQNVLEDLRKYPSAYEEVRRIKSYKEAYLAFEALKSIQINGDLFTSSLEDFKQTVINQVPGVDYSTIEAIAYEAVADWLIRCPLDFPER